VASAALSFGACATETDPVTTTNPVTGGSPSTVAGAPGTVAGTPATGAAGGGAKAGTGGGVTTGTAGTPATGTAGTPAGAAGSPAGAAGTPAATAGTSGAAGGGAAAGASGGAAGGAASGGAATWTKVFEDVLVGTGCGVGACHGNPSVPSKLGLSDKTVAYMGLVGVKAAGGSTPGAMTGGCAGMPIDRVKAGDPDNSLLVQKLEKKHTCGTEMPPGGMLKPDQIKLVRDWIMAGAKDD